MSDSPGTLHGRSAFKRRLAMGITALAALVLPLVANIAPASATKNLSNGPSVIRGLKQYGAGNDVGCWQVVAIPNASNVDVYMTIGPDTNNPDAVSGTSYNVPLNGYCYGNNFANGYAANNYVNVRGDHYHTTTVNGVV